MGLALFLLFSFIISVTYCAIELSVVPEVIRLGNDAKLIIRCKLNLVLLKIDRVYSIMMRRREHLFVVTFANTSDNVYGKTVKEANVISSLSTPEAYVQVTLPTVTCDDSGDYSCSMAVRQNHRSMVLGPVKEYLKMTGESCRFIDTFIYPKKPHKTGDLVRITCFILVQYATSDWQWFLGNDATLYKSKEEGCQLVADGVMNCSSLLEYSVNISSTLTCQLGNASRSVMIDVEDNVAEAPWKTHNVEQILTFTQGDHVKHISYTTYMLGGLCSVMTMAAVLLTLKTRSTCYKRRWSSAENQTDKDEEVQLSQSHISDLHSFTKEDFTTDNCEKCLLTSSQKCDNIV
ncbi:uncharacterized protein LOC124255885 [Haliotis rubra]|uniref:uncharacterized protein LOC124255885 n=1 Tax=Haliotis rubra TaxID=36100 RepID=UPI001EE544A1|nr:uncharacterized protein LOC124255885 [Haliotis rubra]